MDARLVGLSPSDRWRWFTLNCVASINGGALPSVEEICAIVGATAATVERWLAKLTAAGLFVQGDGGLVPAEVGPCPMARKGVAEEVGKRRPMTAAERQRAYRARRRDDREAAGGVTRVTEAVTASVTDGHEKASPEELENINKSISAPDAREERDENFDRFWSAFPARHGENPRFPALVAWRKALAAGAVPDRLIAAAEAYRTATAGRPAQERRFICSAARWLSEGRWRDGGPVSASSEPASVTATPAKPPAPTVWLAAGTPQFNAWCVWWAEHKGGSPPRDARNGWRFPSEWPPGWSVAA